jgi:hypothetical protein
MKIRRRAIVMVVGNRGKIKVQPASFMPLGFKMTRAMFKDQARQPRPLIDEYEAEAFNQCLAYTMEYRLPVKLTVWNEGFREVVTGHIQRVDPIAHQLRVEVKPGEFQLIDFVDVVGVVVLD